MYMTPKILLVDDDNVFLHVYATILQQHFTVDAVDSAAHGLDLLAKDGPYATVITDLRMPGVDGLDFLRQVKRLSPRTKKILFTGKPDLESVVTAVNDAQIFGYLGKDVPPEELIDMARKAIKEYQRDEPTSGSHVLTPEERSFFSRGDDES